MQKPTRQRLAYCTLHAIKARKFGFSERELFSCRVSTNENSDGECVGFYVSEITVLDEIQMMEVMSYVLK